MALGAIGSGGPPPGSVPARILVVDDEPITARTLVRMVRHFGHEAVVAEGVEQAIARCSETTFDVVLTDLNLGGWSGFDLLRHLRDRAPEIPVVLITGYATIDSAMEAIQAGAYDYIAKPPTLEALGDLLRRAIEKRRTADAALPPVREERAEDEGFHNIVGRSPQMLEIYKTVARAAPGRSSVMILGESGTGKELVARALHRRSRLLETELFGHVRGAFTGAVTSRRGLFEEAHEGTLFLDEIGDLSLPLQAKLLRAIQEHRIKPVGGNEEIEIDVRLVVATHQNLDEMLAAGRFREDLYYRLNVVTLSLPALRERREDIPFLMSHFLVKYSRLSGRPLMRFSPEAERALLDYPWPGNVRELENV
ncbi:MAG: sigma-54-dependent Fis family transcriptional regulator, partial [Candidatus Eisenbacteria bacterium]